MKPAISLTGVGRRYGQHRALDDVTVDIATPSITGLLGRNGAGKSTLLRILAGQEFATSGRVSVFGARARGERCRTAPHDPHPGGPNLP
jgi:ABC-2 type transport system ATP-binding protein